MNGRVIGPLDDASIEDLLRRRPDLRVSPARRTGEADWRTLEDYAPSAPLGVSGQPLKPLRLRMSLAIGTIWASMIVTSVSLANYLWVLWFYHRLETDAGFSEAAILREVELMRAADGVLSPLMAAIGVISILAIVAWIYRSMDNAWKLRPDVMTILPGWTIAWFLIPIANLWMPFRAMRQNWVASHDGKPPPRAIWVWWLAWVTAGVVAVVAQARTYALAQGPQPSVDALRPLVALNALEEAAFVVCCLALLVLVRGVSHAQLADPSGDRLG